MAELSDVLSEARQRVVVAAENEYPMAGVYGFGRGVLFRPAVRGADISASHLFSIASDQIIYSRLKAFEGAFAVVPAEAEGRFVTNEFPTFDVDRSKAVPAFIGMILAQPLTWAKLAESITGVGARRERLQVNDFLSFEFELPPLDEQERIASAVGAAEAVARTGQDEALAAKSLARALARQQDSPRVRLGDVAELDIERVQVVADDEYTIAGVTIAGGGLFQRETLRGNATTYPALHRLRENQLVYRKLTAWEGPITVVSAEFEGMFVSPEFPTFTLDQLRIHPNYLRFVCEWPNFHADMKARATGTAERRNRLKPADLLDIEIDLPPLEEQARIADVYGTALVLERQSEAAVRAATALRDSLLAGERRISEMPAA